MDEPALRLERATYRYGALLVLAETTLSLTRGDCLVVVGANGSGKSTFVELCAGLIAPTSGHVMLGGQRPDRMTSSELFRAGVRRGVVFQSGGLISNMPALANVTLPLRYHADVLGLSDDDVERQARAALEELGVTSPDIHAMPAHLSSGVQRRVAIARALAIRPNFVFFDDPFVGLDGATRHLVLELLLRLDRDENVTLVVASSSASMVSQLAHTPYELEAGVLVARRQQAMLSLPPVRWSRDGG